LLDACDEVSNVFNAVFIPTVVSNVPSAAFDKYVLEACDEVSNVFNAVFIAETVATEESIDIVPVVVIGPPISPVPVFICDTEPEPPEAVTSIV
jgi:hypothetical protein